MTLEEQRRIAAQKQKEKLISGLTGGLMGFGKKVYQGNPLMQAIGDPIRDVFRNYDAEMQDGVPQIVASKHNPLVIEANRMTSQSPHLGKPYRGSTFSKSLLDKYREKNNQIPRLAGTSDSLTRFDEEEFGSPKLPFNPNMLEAIRAGGAKHHEGMPISAEMPENNQSLWKTWGSLADDPKKRKDAYLGSIKNIYMKKMLLDSIAKLTGGKSQGDIWAQMAITELDAIEKFDSEERLHNQWKALFFREDGTYDPPKNRKEAMERGGKLGYSPSQMKDILSVFQEKEDKIEEDDRSAYEKLLDKAVEKGWITENERNRSVKSKLGLDVDVKSATALQRNIETALAAGAITSEQANEARRYALLGGKQGSDKGFSARSQMIRLYLQDRRVMGAASNIIKEDAPSFTAWLLEPRNAATLNSLLGGAALSGSDVIDLGEI